MPNQINSATDIFKQNQNDIFADGRTDATSGTAGGIVTASLADGQNRLTASIDGDLSLIDTEQKAETINLTAHTGGNADDGWSRNFLLVLLDTLVQGITAKLSEVRARQRVSAFSVDTVQTSASGTAYQALPSGAATQITAINTSGTELSLAKGGAGESLLLADGFEIVLPVLANSNEWSIKRSDESTTQVSAKILRVTK